MIHLIESLDDSATTTMVEGRTFPAYAVVEDDDGIRWFLTWGTSFIQAHTWVRAYSSGCAALLAPTASGYCAMTTETFMDQRCETNGGYATKVGWREFTSLPSYDDLLSAATYGTKPVEKKRGLVHLHNHSEYSGLDAISMMSEMTDIVVEQGGFALGCADHGNVVGHPDLQRECDKAGLKPVFGMEAYFVDDRLTRLSDFDNDQTMSAQYPDEASLKAVRAQFVAGLRDYYHLVLFAVDQEGLHNLWAMSTESFRDGFYGKPRLDWATLRKYANGVIATSACLRGPLTHHGLLEGDEEAARARLARLLDIFDDRFYIEVHTNQLPEQIKVNHELVALAKEFKVPLLASVDSHYPKIDDREAHRVWLSMQTDSDMADEGTLFAGGQDYHIKSESEVRDNLAYLGQAVVDEAIENTAVVADMCTATVSAESKPPIFSKVGGAAADADRLLDLCLNNWHKVLGKRESEAACMARFEHEFPMLVRKGFCGYYLMTSEQTRWARSQGILVGPGRGSGAGSVVAYLAEITDIDPVDADLLFERFMTEGRTALPDFDVDYPASKKAIVQQHARDVYGEDHVAVVGSISRLKSKGIIKKLGAAMKSSLPDTFYMDQIKISAIITDAEGDTAGLGLSWEDLWDKAGDKLQPYRDQYPHLFEMADRLVGRANTLGQHASGLVITTDAALTEQLPMRRADEDGHMIAQFDKDVLEELGFVKFDLLTLRNLDIIQDCVDLIKERRGHTVDVYSWRDEYTDPQVWEEIAEAHTLGIFQIETQLGTQYAKRMQPRTMADLSDLVTIVRPGPRNSGLTETYLKRRAGLEPVTYPDARLARVLAKTHGAMLYQEQIMGATMLLAGYDSNKADEVRKILGKKKVELVAAAGQEFVARAIENGMQPADAAALWSQMAEFAKYCVSGDTEISLAGSGRFSGGTLEVERAYRRLHTPLREPVIGRTKTGQEFAGPCDACGATETAHHWARGRCNACYVWRQKFLEPGRGVHALSYYADGRIRPSRIFDVMSSGDQEVWTVTLSDGRSITATANHRHLTDKGYREVGHLSIGDRLLVDGGYQMPTAEEYQRRGRLSRGEPRRAGTVNGAYGVENYAYIDGGTDIWKSWRAATPKVCAQCGTTEGVIEQAHLNGDHQDQRWENYAWLCSSCHKRYDYAVNDRVKRWQKGHLSTSAEVVSITFEGVQATYDVVMDAPHNFVANGIVTHNSFGGAHAYSYAVLGFWEAWLKFHYPVEFLTAALSSVDKDRIPDFVKEARRMGFSVLPPDINESGSGFRAGTLSVRYGLDSIKGIGIAALAIENGAPYASFEDFMERTVEPKGSKVNRGHVALLARIGAFDKLVVNRRGLEQVLLGEKTGESTKCVRKNLDVVNPVNDLPCVYDWSTEPAPINPRTDKKMKMKAPPKRCTKACRQYIAPPPVQVEEITPYNDADIRDIEQEMLGVFLSSTPFDMLPTKERETTRSQAELLMIDRPPEGMYLIAGVLTKMRPHRDRAGQEMGFIAIDTEVSTVEVTCFNSTWVKFKRDLKVGTFYAADVERNSRGQTLYALMPYQQEKI
jgi:DNA polymerase-3 subunit alpha